MKFPHLEKFANLIKDLQYEHQSIFPLCGRVKPNFRDRYGKPNIFSENLSHCQVFSTVKVQVGGDAGFSLCGG